MAKKKEDSIETPPAPAFLPDAGAVFQRDRAGSPRGRELTEGAANFDSFSQSIRDSATPPEAA